MSEDSEPVEAVVDRLYKYLDGVAQEQAKKFKTTCTKGCAACCYLMATIGATDGYMIALEILKKEDWQSWLPKLSVAAGKASYKGITKQSYFAQGNPCVFLDVTQGTCTIYEKRPACCRFHYVTSDPKLCSHTNTERPETSGLNLMPLEQETWRLDIAVGKEMGFAIPPVAPIPIMVLWMMEFITRNDLSVHGEIEKYCIGVPDPFKWWTEYSDGIVDDQDIETVNRGLGR
jgi:Fe-S-cluster containining protein